MYFLFDVGYIVRMEKRSTRGDLLLTFIMFWTWCQILIFCNVYFYDRDSSSGLKHQPQQNWLDGGNILTATQYKDAEM